MAISPVAVSATLAKDEVKQQKSIYYAIHVLLNVEIRYPKIEKLAIALVVATHKLNLYLQAHSVSVLIDLPLKKFIHNPSTSGQSMTNKGGVKFLIVSIYYTKWVETRLLARIAEFNVKKFMRDDVIYRFRVPKILLSDNNKQFDNPAFRRFYETTHVDSCNSSVAYPQSNGQAEAINRALLDGMMKQLDKEKAQWAEELLSMLWSYRTLARHQ
ncbi:uncharacterized protein LOC122070553 [Macadamia integrifolia]|uniref:uncharacterized protein LOC122070553 n=1 Tax=Macadamia integrifolia TaxID=60698 RepID=UPI001C4EC33B|nr:uncharacterized protein LOC122070553 [Macadamia integrifolia]